MIELGLYMLFKVKSNGKSMNCSASRDANPCGTIALTTKGFLIHLCLSMSLEKYLLKCEIRESKCK